MPYIEVKDGTQLFYMDSGSGRPDAGQPMVFLSSATMNSQMWELHAPRLVENGRRCVVYDRRGHGRSDWPWHGYDYDTLADDLDALINRLDLRDVTLVGCAMGCAEIVRYLSRHGAERVARIVLISTITPAILRSPTNPGGVDPAFLDQTLAALRADRARYTVEIEAPFFGGPTATPADLPISPELARWFGNLSLQCSLPSALAVYRLLFTGELGPELASITVPTLLIHGDLDPLAPLELCARRTAQAIPGSELVVYERASHGLAVTEADRLTTDLLAFTAR